ncbi:MAG: hypothetical protein JXN63_06765 [Candidatus Delongbacteria bacterium]|nr:hypothetical protein [Candidatus Delongbacteria bacterium]
MTFLPDKIEKLDTETVQVYIDRLYEYYLQELKSDDFTYEGLFIYHKTQPAVDGKDGGFWHIVTKEYLDQNKRPITLPCIAKNGFPVCMHPCRLFQEYDPWRTVRITYPDGKTAPPRYLCLNRCERINWIKPIIKEAERNPDNLKIWDKKYSDNQINRHIWYERQSYLIVLGRWKNESKYNLLTSFATEYNDKKSQCQKEYQRYINNGNQPI